MWDCEIRNAGQELAKVLWDSSYIYFGHCAFHDSGLQETGKYGEAVYIGSSGGVNDETHHITAEDCEFWNLTAEAWDVKSQGTHDTIFRRNVVRDCTWPNYGSTKYNQGMVALGQQHDGSYDYAGDLNHLVEYNRIWNCHGHASSTAYQDVAGLMAWAGGCTVRHNIVWDCDHSGLEFRHSYDDAEEANDTYTVENNTVWGNNVQESSGGIRFETKLSSTVHDYNDNVGDNDSISSTGTLNQSGNEMSATTADFVGPVTGTADAGAGPGSGFVLASSSSIPATAGAAGKES